MDLTKWQGKGPIYVGRRRVGGTIYGGGLNEPGFNPPGTPFPSQQEKQAEPTPVESAQSLWNRPATANLDQLGLGGDLSSDSVTGAGAVNRVLANNAIDTIQANPSSRTYADPFQNSQGLGGVAGFSTGQPAPSGNIWNNSATRGNYVPSFGSGALNMPQSSNPYIVKPGDTLGAIAQDLGGGYSKFPQIARDNGIKNPNLIYPGQKINLPAQNSPAMPNPTQAAGGAAADNIPLGPPNRQTMAYEATAANNGAKIVNGVYVGNATQDLARQAAGEVNNATGLPQQEINRQTMKIGPTVEQQMQLAEATHPQVQVAQIKSESDRYRADQMLQAATIKAQTALAMPKTAQGGLTDEAKAGLAEYVKMTGSLPPLGMGAAAAQDRRDIFNMAFGKGDFTGQDMGTNQATFSANKSAMGKLEGQAGLALAFEKTANKNADLALGLSNKVDRTGSPVVNRFYLKAKGQYAGDPDVAAFEAAVKTFANEYAKVTTGQTGGAAVSDSARAEIDKLINASQTPEQFAAVINLMKQEMRNRAAAYGEQRAEMKNQINPAKAFGPDNFEHFLEKVKERNKGQSLNEQEVRAYYDKTYGGK